MRIIYEGTDIYPEVSVNSCTHDMYAAGQSDALVIKFNNTRRLWDVWQPAPGDIITVTDGPATTGKMFIDSITPENGLVTMLALSCPPSGFTIVNKAWEQVLLTQILSSIAFKNGLKYESYGLVDQQYRYINQAQSDFSFLATRLTLESCAFLVFDGRLVVYSEPYMEAIAPITTLSIGSDGNFECRDDSAMTFKKALIECGVYTGTFTATSAVGNRILSRNLSTQVGSGPEANRFAKGLLRNANKKAVSGHILQGFSPHLAAGSTTILETDGEKSWNGPVFLDHVRHDYTNYKSKLFFRKPLEGY